MIIRPGSKTANELIHKQQLQAGARPKERVEWWVQRVRYSDFSDADTSQALNLNTAFPHNAFPADAFILPFSYLDLRQTFGGGTINAATLILGYSGDTNGLVESTDVFTGQSLGVKFTGGTAYATTTNVGYQAAVAPLLQLDTTAGNINTLTSGVVDVWIKFEYRPTSRPL